MVSSARRVPVSSRATSPQNKPRRELPKIKLSVAEVGVVIVVAILILMMVAVPLRNYFQGRTEIARVSAAIVEKQNEKDRLEAELERYQSDAYVREQARQRLGLVAPGETAYRVLDSGAAVAAEEAEAAEASQAQPWYQIVWDSIAATPDDTPAAEEPLEQGEVDTNMPLQ